MKTKIVSIALTIAILLSLGSVTAFAEEVPDYVSILVENGYTRETAEVLPIEDQKEIAEKLLTNPSDVDIATLSLEVDLLSEAEALFTYSDADLIAMGATKEAIAKTKGDLLNLYGLSDEDLAEKLDVNTTEASLFKKAISSGLSSEGKSVVGKTGVSASGSITSSEMTYTQTKTNNSTKSAPSYAIKLSYN